MQNKVYQNHQTLMKVGDSHGDSNLHGVPNDNAKAVFEEYSEIFS